MQKLIWFLGIDETIRRHAAAVWPVVESISERLLNEFYSDVSQCEAVAALEPEIVERLKKNQLKHWKALLTSDFSEDYFKRASLIGIMHREVDLDPKWFIAGYFRLTQEIVRSVLALPLPLDERYEMMHAFSKCIALDMALAVSSYSSWLVD